MLLTCRRCPTATSVVRRDTRGRQNPEESRADEDGVAVEWEVGPGRGQHSLSLLLSASPHGTGDNLEAVVTELAVF